MKFTRFGLAAAGVASAGAVIAGAAVANASTSMPEATLAYTSASDSGTGSSSSSSGESTSPGTTAPGTTAPGDQKGQNRRGGSCDGAGGGRGMGHHTEVTGDEAAKVGDAVKAKDSAVTIESIQKDPDGSYDVLGTKDGNRVRYEVSADLATITQDQRGGPGWMGRGMHGRGDGAGDQAPGQGSTSGATAQSSGFRTAV